MVNSEYALSPCINPLNCVFFQRKFKNAEKKFEQLVNIAENLPRTKVLEKNNTYWKGVCRSLIFRFPDELEILRKDTIIQIKSASRFGAGDLGVNGRRVGNLLTQLEKLK